MKKSLLIVLYIFICCMFIQAQEGNFRAMDIQQEMKPSDKLAILMVHFGTTHDNTRTLTIDAINQKTRETFPTIEVREAYTSRIIIRRLKERGIIKQTPEEMLKQLNKEGYTHILVQPTELLDGVEMESLQKEISNVSPLFKEIRLGRPLLYSTDDFAQVIQALSKDFSIKGATVLMGHGTYKPITASYTMLDYMLKAKNYSNVYVGTVEGYPSFQDMLNKLHKDKQTEVTLIPFMFVAGEHAHNDMAIKWRQALEKDNFKVTTLIKGLGENPDIQNIYINHLKFIKANKPLDIEQKKAEYAAGKEKQ
ncbi:MAG: sirohydrochlorin cobaltochelatase [Parabacteroides sp.]|nr:sirohydrochlorin cobaltochelatase [Parabacteroides sp.]